jgi:hypothetical protein
MLGCLGSPDGVDPSKRVTFSENHDVSSNQAHGGVYGRIPRRVDGSHGGQCDPAIAHRADCGMAVGKDEYSCVTAGCCWDPTASLRPDPNSAVPWCYHKQPPPAKPGADPQRYWAQKKAMLLM